MKYIFLSFFCCTFLCSKALGIVDTTIGISAPKDVTGDYKALAHFLCDGQAGDQAKANAIYNWLTHNIRYDIKATRKIDMKPVKEEKVLKARSGACVGYSKLFVAMCKEAGLKAVTIDGYAKNWLTDNGDKVFIPRHMWAAVMIDGKWQFADPTWGAGSLHAAPEWWRKAINTVLRRKITYTRRIKFRFGYDSTYFMQDPETFRLTHLPADPMWQLTDTVMPLQVFEAGDSAVMLFNEKYSKLKQDNPALAVISEMDESKASIEAADRAYAYNNRCPVILAVKQSLRSNDDIEQILNDSAAGYEQKRKLLDDAVRALKISEEHVKDQKKFFPDEYNELKKKNREKSIAAKQGIMKMETDDKQMLASCKKYQKATDIKNKRILKKVSDAHTRKRTLDARKVEDMEPAKIQKQVIEPEMLVLSDSITKRKFTIDTLQLVINAKDSAIVAKKAQSIECLDSLLMALRESDSFLIKETIARLNKKDNYDDEVIRWSSLYRQAKYVQADTLQRHYTAYFDTIMAMYEDVHKVRVWQYDVYKKNLRDIEKYGKWNSNDTSVTNRYPEWVNNYSASIDTGNSIMADAQLYAKKCKTTFAALAKRYNRQLKISGYMTKAEAIRKKVEQGSINGHQAFDNYENRKQASTLKKRILVLETYVKAQTKDHL